jgi:hypothetical protein
MSTFRKTLQKLVRGRQEHRTISTEELRQLARQRGYDLVARHYYSPVPQEEDLAGPGFWDGLTALRGVDMGESAALALVSDVLPRYLAEFRDRFAVEPGGDPGEFHVVNGVYMAVDAHVYYAFIRHFKPRRIIEIGSGQSTRVAVAALQANAADGTPGELTCVEPFPGDGLKGLVAVGKVRLVESRVQDLGTAFFATLQPGDMLFIDSTHVLREGSDVQFEYLELLPALPPNVFVHVHDISLPRRYPRCYVEQGIFWNEQYLLQAFLAYNSRFEVLWAGNYLLLRHPALMQATFPEIAAMRSRYPLAEPSALWMRSK